MGVSVCSRRQKRGGAKSQHKQTQKKRHKHSIVGSKASHKILKTNVEKLLANPAANVFEDTEWADKIIEKFKSFLDRIEDLEDRVYKKGGNSDTLSDISILKIDIASKLLDVFGKGGEEKAAVSDFNDDLSALLNRITI